MLPNLLFFKREIVRLGSKMDHMSVNLAIGRREKKIFGGIKSSRSGKKPIIKTEKKSGDLFFYVSFFSFFLETVKFLWGRQKNQQKAPNGNVTPLRTTTSQFVQRYILFTFVEV